MIKIITGTPASIELEFNSWLKENCLISYSLQYTETQGEEGICSTLLVNYETEERLEWQISDKLIELIHERIKSYFEVNSNAINTIAEYFWQGEYEQLKNKLKLLEIEMNPKSKGCIANEF